MTVNAKILEIDNDIPKCLLDTDVNNFVCKLKIEYEYNNSKYVKLVEYIGNTQYNKGDIIKIQFSAKDPSFIVLNMEYSKVSKPKGYFLIFLGIFFIMVIWKLYHIFKNEVK